jgi:hypothetical protein
MLHVKDPARCYMFEDGMLSKRVHGCDMRRRHHLTSLVHPCVNPAEKADRMAERAILKDKAMEDARKAREAARRARAQAEQAVAAAVRERAEAKSAYGIAVRERREAEEAIARAGLSTLNPKL